MRSFQLNIAERKEGPFTETEIAQMFANGRVDRNTPCKPYDHGEWKTINDYLPMLKYGMQLPPVTNIPAIPAAPPAVLSPSQRVSVIDFDIPFGSVLKIIFKWMAAGLVVGLCFLPAIFVFCLIVAAIFAALLAVQCPPFIIRDLAYARRLIEPGLEHSSRAGVMAAATTLFGGPRPPLQACA